MSPTSDPSSSIPTPPHIRPRRPHLQDSVLRAHAYSHTQSRRSSLHGSPTALRLSWLFRSNIPARRGSPLPDVQKRNFFGISEILSVLTNVRPPSPPPHDIPPLNKWSKIPSCPASAFNLPSTMNIPPLNSPQRLYAH